MELTKEARDVLFQLNTWLPTKEYRVVGGYVRDLLLGKEPKDIDVATSATPIELMEALDAHGVRYIPTGLDHGTITVIVNDIPIEVTTLRIDRSTDGRHAAVEYTTDWAMDALRRDFTINAMSIDYYGQLYDYFDGKHDLQIRRVRFVGDADARIKEDYLRILRYFRFVGKIDGASIQEQELKAITQNWVGLKNISGERVWSEFMQILSHTPNRYKVVDALFSLNNIFDVLNIEYIYNHDLNYCSNDAHVQDHTYSNIYFLTNILHFAGHSYYKQSQSNVDHLRERMKFDTKTYNILSYLSKANDSSTKVPNNTLEVRNALHLGEDRIMLSHLLRYKCDDFHAKYCLTAELEPFPINGNDIKAHGVSGKEIARVLYDLKKIWINSNSQLTRDQLYDTIATIK